MFKYYQLVACLFLVFFLSSYQDIFGRDNEFDQFYNTPRSWDSRIDEHNNSIQKYVRIKSGDDLCRYFDDVKCGTYSVKDAEISIYSDKITLYIDNHVYNLLRLETVLLWLAPNKSSSSAVSVQKEKSSPQKEANDTTVSNRGKTDSANTAIKDYKNDNQLTSMDSLQAYAKPLVCPKEMVLVDIPYRSEKSPFFKVCVDRYEFPNVEDSTPITNVSFSEAEKLCRNLGKRLCTESEWRWACSGLNGYFFPYGFTYKKDKCNDNYKSIEPSGKKDGCESSFGIKDMVGNALEWVTLPDGGLALAGGPLSRCNNIIKNYSETLKNSIGFRCCKSNVVTNENKLSESFDTIFVKNPQLDANGRECPNLIYAGSIISEDNNSVSIISSDGATKKINRDQITRVITNESSINTKPYWNKAIKNTSLNNDTLDIADSIRQKLNPGPKLPFCDQLVSHKKSSAKTVSFSSIDNTPSINNENELVPINLTFLPPFIEFKVPSQMTFSYASPAGQASVANLLLQSQRADIQISSVTFKPDITHYLPIPIDFTLERPDSTIIASIYKYNLHLSFNYNIGGYIGKGSFIINIVYPVELEETVPGSINY